MQTVKEKMRRWKRARRKVLNMKYRITIRKGSPIDIVAKLLGCALFVGALIWALRLYIIVAQGGF